MRKIQESDVDNIINLYIGGYSSGKIAEMYNVDPSLIVIYLKNNSIKMRGLNKLSDEDVNKVIELYNSGLPLKKIASMFNVSDVTIGNYLKRAGIHIRNDCRDDLDIDLLVDMYNSGMSMRSIAIKFNTNHVTISRKIRDKVEMRDNFYYYVNGIIGAKPRICVNCGKEFLLRDENGKAIPRYKTCSDKCLHEFLSHKHSDEKSLTWKGGSSQGYYQKKAKVHKTMQCERCGERNVRLDVHHIDKDKSNNSVENIMILCVSCHAKLHYENGDSGIRGAP